MNISHDVALALAYLHSNDVIHRDLSSNNVLLIGAGNRAKVTDFGMAKLFDANRSTMTMCPGTQAYMSPEALDDPPVYTKKLDAFSFGVLGIQIITRQFPDPGPRTKKVQDPRDPKRRLQEVVLETERRNSHICLINPTHPLLPMATACLSYNEEDRPSAQELCHSLAELKGAQQYSESVQQARERSRPTDSAVRADRMDGEREIWEVQQEKERCETQIQNLHLQLQQITLEKDEARERLKQQLEASEQIITQFQQKIQGLQEENQCLQEELDNVSQKEELKLKWKTCKAAQRAMRKGSATESGRDAYFRPAFSGEVHSYNLDADKWNTLPDCHRESFTLTFVNGLLTVVGGVHHGNYTNTLLSLKEEGGKKWVEQFPPMPTKRKYTAAVSTGKILVVAGGEIEGTKLTILSTVEVMNTDTQQWSTASGLPYPLIDASATVSGGRVYLVGGKDKNGHPTQSVLTCSLNALFQSQTDGSVWNTVADLPVVCSTSITLNGQLLAVGGKDSHGKATNNIYSYNTKTNSWEVTGHMPTARYWCLVAVFPGNKLMVVGGQGNDAGNTDKAEIATCQ